MPSSRGSSQSRDRTRVSYVSCIGRWVLYHQPHLALTKEAEHVNISGNWWLVLLPELSSWLFPKSQIISKENVYSKHISVSSRCYNRRMVLSSYATPHSKIEQEGMNFNQNNFLWTLSTLKCFLRKFQVMSAARLGSHWTWKPCLLENLS